MRPRPAESLPTLRSPCGTPTRSSANRPIRRPLTSWPSTLARGLFPPQPGAAKGTWMNKGKQKTSHVTVNGVLEVQRTIYWNPQQGTTAPLDGWLGILPQRYSCGVREMACRLCLDEAFVPASENLLRLAQLSLSQ